VKTAYSFTNREWDADAGMYYYRARYYDPGIGRFISEDPHYGKAPLPMTFNSKYIYALNNPNMYVDPNGKFPWVALALAIISTSMEYLFDPEKSGTDEEFWVKIIGRTFLYDMVLPEFSGLNDLSALVAKNAYKDIGLFILKKGATSYASYHVFRWVKASKGNNPKEACLQNSQIFCWGGALTLLVLEGTGDFSTFDYFVEEPLTDFFTDVEVFIEGLFGVQLN
jgi:RHS repeat-associated protein